MPIAAFTSKANAEVITYTNSSTGGVGTISYAWDFADGTAREVTSSQTVTVQAQVEASSGGGGSIGWILLSSIGLLFGRRKKLM